MSSDVSRSPHQAWPSAVRRRVAGLGLSGRRRRRPGRRRRDRRASRREWRCAGPAGRRRGSARRGEQEQRRAQDHSRARRSRRCTVAPTAIVMRHAEAHAEADVTVGAAEDRAAGGPANPSRRPSSPRAVASSPVPQARFSPSAQPSFAADVLRQRGSARRTSRRLALVAEVAPPRPCPRSGRPPPGCNLVCSFNAGSQRAARSSLCRHSNASRTSARLPPVRHEVGSSGQSA